MKETFRYCCQLRRVLEKCTHFEERENDYLTCNCQTISQSYLLLFADCCVAINSVNLHQDCDTVSFTIVGKTLGWSKVLKLQNNFFATFLGRIRIFWKMMFGKMQKIFWYDHSNACQKCSKVLLHNAPMWIRTKQKIGFF